MKTIDLALVVALVLPSSACGDDTSDANGSAGGGSGTGGDDGTGGDAEGGSGGGGTGTGGDASGGGGAATVPELSCAAADPEGLQTIPPSFLEQAPEEGPAGGEIRPGRYELDAVEVYLPPGQSADVPPARIVWEMASGVARQSSDSTNAQGASVFGYYLSNVTTNGPLVTMEVTCSSVEGAAGTSTQFSYTATEGTFTTFIGDYTASEPRIIRRYLRR